MAGWAGLLERDEERLVVSALLAATAQGAGRVVVIEGPAGIGKTSVARACQDEAADHGLLVLRARGSDLESDFAFGVARQLFEPLRYGPARAHRLAGMSERAETSLDALAAVNSSPGSAPDTSFAIINALYWLAVELASRRPVLLCVDDLQWCDEPSVRYLGYLGKRLDGQAVLILATLRSGAHPVAEHAVSLIAEDGNTTVLRLPPLSTAGSARLVRELVSATADDAFCAAFHQATGGNPFLLRELATVAHDEALSADAAGAARVLQLGSRLVRRRVLAQLGRLGGTAGAMAEAVAVLGESTPEQAATLAGADRPAAHRAQGQLAAAGILHDGRPLRFVHPLVRGAVYEGLGHSRRVALHAAAARVLADADEPAERIAAHLMLSPGSGDQRAVAALRQAAELACARGSPKAAMRYLERCLAEPPTADAYLDVREQLGTVAMQVDLVKAAEALAAVLPARSDEAQRSRVAHLLGQTLIFLGRFDDAVRVLQAAIEQSPDDSDGRRRLEGTLLVALTENVVAGGPDVAELAARLRASPSGHGLGSHALDCILGAYDVTVGDGDGIDPAACRERVRRGLADGSLIAQGTGGDAWCCACLFLAATDADDVGPFIDRSLAEAHAHGSVAALATVKIFSGLALFWRGELADAEAHLNEAIELVDASQLVGLRPQAGAFLAYCLVERGRSNEAAAALSWAWPDEPVPELGYWHWLLIARTRLLLADGEPERALATALECGRFWDRRGWHSPLLVPWRSEAALAGQLVGRLDEARDLAARDLAIARLWSAPRTLGLALRVTGLLEGGQAGLQRLQESVAVLDASPARLEHAKSLVELGAATRRRGRRAQARDHLQRGVELATMCGAEAVAERGRTELLATGAHLGDRYRLGPAALTASERRVAELAAAGRSNRDIAQTLYITPKTVEVHLTSIYRKLGIASRSGLRGALAR